MFIPTAKQKHKSQLAYCNTADNDLELYQLSWYSYAICHTKSRIITDEQNYSAVSLVSFPDHLMSSAMYVVLKSICTGLGLGPGTNTSAFYLFLGRSLGMS